MKWIIELSIFSFLILWTISSARRRDLLLKKKIDYWFIDLLSLFIQGTVVPLAQTYLLFRGLNYIFPTLQSSLELNPIIAFSVNFVVVDYLYYLTHKALHRDGLWGFHLVHHTAESMDIFVSSRNSVWTTFLMPYVWINAIFLFLLRDKTAFLISMSASAMLDLWRHSEFMTEAKGSFHRFLAILLITPYEHGLHHSRSQSRVNFGANLNLWDKIHGTYMIAREMPQDLGFEIKSDFKTKLFFPFKLERENK